MNRYMDLKAFRKDVEAALEEVAKKYGVDIHAGNIRYGDNDLNLKLEVTRNDIDVHKVEFLDNIKYSFTAFKPEDYMATFKIKNTEYQLVGFKPRTKFSVLGKRVSDGAAYAFTYDAVKRAFGRE